MSKRLAAFFVLAGLAFGESSRALDFIQNGWHLALGSATGSVTEYSITLKLGEPRQVTRRTEPNRHDPSASNEIVQMHYDGIDITLLKTPQKVFVTDFVISSPKVLVGDAFKVGTSGSRLKELGDGRIEQGRRCYHNLEAYDDSACFTIRDGIIAQVEWHYEID